MTCSSKIVTYMHEYLDEEIEEDHKRELQEHLQTCESCATHFHELKKTIALVQSTSHIQAPLNFTENVLAKLPKEQKQARVKRWVRHHPMLAAASLFLVLMVSSLLSSWNQDHQFSVSKQPNIIVENNTAIVPKGETVKGNIIVRNGDIKIEGQVDGDVTVINGKQYMASASQVTGEIKEIDAVFEWVWYKMKNAAKEVTQLFTGETKEEQGLPAN
ncbi:anti-sigma factor family protein [Bacillus sp. B1-b2]|uniref:anti-sigma factor family protein n=1 Tax=Bacillus sp. B1-b2 TaxID=2653201 RepID=UPI0012619972|nr:anti-sigma factor [Bacillus sp. B1-b2]KAB7668960.1 anti-sigma factor [Bacillus sp. B1-b2]